MTQTEMDEDYEKNTGRTIVFRERNLEPSAAPGVICASHGPFTWGKDSAQAVYHAVVLEKAAKMDPSPARCGFPLAGALADSGQALFSQAWLRRLLRAGLKGE